MSMKHNLLPLIVGQDWWKPMCHPKQILNQRFATVLGDEDLSNSDFHEYKGFKIRPRKKASMKASGISEVIPDATEFRISLDLDDFELGDLKVTTLGRVIEVHGKHEEKKDAHGLVSREFFRQYMVPYNCNIDAITSSFSVDRKLKIKVPRNQEMSEIPDIAVVVPVTEEDTKHVSESEVAEFTEVVDKPSLEGNEPGARDEFSSGAYAGEKDHQRGDKPLKDDISIEKPDNSDEVKSVDYVEIMTEVPVKTGMIVKTNENE